jgi:hypothetical protein
VVSDPVSSSRHIARSVRISRTTRSCTLLVKGYETCRTRVTFGGGYKPPPTPSLPVEILTHYKRQDSSAFALTYILRLRSCRVMGEFVISPLLSLSTKSLCAAGPPRSTGVTPLQRYYGPSRHRLVFSRFPGVSGYTAYPAPPISRRGEDGFSSCLACPCHRAAPTTPPE